MIIWIKKLFCLHRYQEWTHQKVRQCQDCRKIIIKEKLK